MDRDLQADWEEFRKLVKGSYDNLKERFPETSGKHWVVRCYESVVSFGKRFPTAKRRRSLFDRLEKIKEISDSHPSILRAFSVKKPNAEGER